MAHQEPGSQAGDRFATTNWKLIAAAQGEDVPEARKALADLCAAYWYPLYAYLRRKSHPPDRAQDLTQGFFTNLLGNHFLAGIAPGKGKFRTFLLKSLENYLTNQRLRDHARKRGGGRSAFSIDLPDAEGRYAYEPVHGLTAERLFERRWALTLLERVLDRLGAEMAADRKGPLFERLGPALLGGGEAASYGEIAAALGMTEGAVKVAAHRIRRRYRELIREEVARTVDRDEDVEEEIRALFVAMAR
jgi:DNA-directed RNA polymerase specialized sigma24 family protein